jgi:hypothetical protein
MNSFLNAKHEWYDIRNSRISIGRAYFNRPLEFYWGIDFVSLMSLVDCGMVQTVWYLRIKYVHILDMCVI